MSGRDPSPWHSVPAADYEGHMASPQVGQLQFLSRVFADALAEFRPAAVAVLGCATGNGFEHLRPEAQRRVVGVDFQPDYLALARARHAARLPGLELVCADLESVELEGGAFDLVHAALVLEYVEPGPLVRRAARWLAPGGVLVAVLQLPAEGHGKVTETPFAGVRRLEPVIRLVEPGALRAQAAAAGLAELRGETTALPAGKAFFTGVYARAAITGGEAPPALRPPAPPV